MSSAPLPVTGVVDAPIVGFLGDHADQRVMLECRVLSLENGLITRDASTIHAYSVKRIHPRNLAPLRGAFSAKDVRVSGISFLVSVYRP